MLLKNGLLKAFLQTRITKFGASDNILHDKYQDDNVPVTEQLMQKFEAPYSSISTDVYWMLNKNASAQVQDDLQVLSNRQLVHT